MNKRIISVVIICLLFMSACDGHYSGKETDSGTYGVFIGTDTDLDRLGSFYTVVIDAQYYDADEINAFKDKGHKVYSYINVGSLEEFRDIMMSIRTWRSTDMSIGMTRCGSM